MIVEPDLETAEAKLLATDGLRKFYQGLKTPKEKDDFRNHLRRYMQIYLPDCPFEVSSTNRYTIVTHEARVTARKFIRKGQPVKYLSGIQVLISPKEEEALSARKKDFSIVVSSRNKCASLFMGPARFANHDCGANARLMITGQAGIEIIATQNIETGDEITVTYGENYFGEDNCECLCKTCEDNVANGWAQASGNTVVKKSIEEVAAEGYSLRRRRRDDSAASVSRTPSVTPDIRPRVPKSRSKALKGDSRRTSLARSPGPETLLREKRKREFESLTTPPVTPAKKRKTIHCMIQSVPTPQALFTRSSDEDSISGGSTSELGAGDMVMTDATTPESDIKEPTLQSPEPSPEKPQAPSLKQENSTMSSSSEMAPSPLLVEDRDSITAVPLPTIESIPKPNKTADDNTTTQDGKTNKVLIEQTTLSTPTSPVANAAEDSPTNISLITSQNNASDERSTPDRGRSRSLEEPREVKATDEESFQNTKSSQRVRVPGDYTLTAVLLSEPDTAWVHCTICSEAFVQQNAYFTRSACPRCERHSKLYGYQWPKTEKEGPSDKEERVLDHRMIHRFLDPEDEMRIRGRKLPSSSSSSSSSSLKPPTSKPSKQSKLTESRPSTATSITTVVAATITAATTTTATATLTSTTTTTTTTKTKMTTQKTPSPPQPETPVKRGRGRPRKHPRPSTSSDDDDGDDDEYVADRNCAAAVAAAVGREDSRRSSRRQNLSLRAAVC